jgi:hypothetical protein
VSTRLKQYPGADLTKTTSARMVFVLLHTRMDPKPQKPSFLFANPLALWADLAFKLWGFGAPPAAEKEVAVAVIPTRDAQPRRAKGKARRKSKSKRARR